MKSNLHWRIFRQQYIMSFTPVLFRRYEHESYTHPTNGKVIGPLINLQLGFSVFPSVFLLVI